MKRNRTEAHVAFEGADNLWHCALIDAFGVKQAAQARYETRGKGESGSSLRALWELREGRRIAWEGAA
jgi:hypothetical protein